MSNREINDKFRELAAADLKANGSYLNIPYKVIVGNTLYKAHLRRVKKSGLNETHTDEDFHFQLQIERPVLHVGVCDIENPVIFNKKATVNCTCIEGIRTFC